MKAYTYLIGWSQLSKFYYGVRFANNCKSEDLMVTYFTSSKQVKQFISTNGLPDIIQIRKRFDDVNKARNWETKVLVKIKAHIDERFLNKTSNISIIKTNFFATDKTRAKMSASRRGNSSPLVGKGSGDRARDHIRDAKRWIENGRSRRVKNNFHKLSKIVKIIELGRDPVILKVFQHTSQDVVYLEEQRIIETIGISNLTNLKDGGVGGIGSKHSKEHRQSMLGENNKGAKAARKPVVVMDLDGNDICTYQSFRDTVKFTGISLSQISKCIKDGGLPTSNKFFRYQDSQELDDGFIDRESLVNQYKRSFVNQYNLDGTLVQSFESVRQASTTLEISYDNLWRKVQQGKGGQPYHGYLWGWYGDIN